VAGPSDERTRALAALTGHDFADQGLAIAALTHPSVGERESRQCYERLEFLGDRVLALVIAEALLERFPTENEGALSKRLVGLVRREALAHIADAIDLEQHIRVAPAAQSEQGRARESMLADACEALIGALFLDGGLDPARAFVRRHWEGLLDATRKPPRDAKTSLQEWLQGHGFALPLYEVVGQTGPAHAPRFSVRVTAENGEAAEAEGRSKRAAEQAAAKLLLARVERRDD
jgi:ribonuclease III